MTRLIFETTYTRRLTSWHSKLSDDVCFLRLRSWVAQPRLKVSNVSSFICEQKYHVWEYVFLVRTQRTFWYQNSLTLLKCLYLSFTSNSSMFKQRGVIRRTIRLSLGMWEKESIIDVQCRQESPSPRVRHLSGKLGKPPFPLECRTLGLGLSCPRWTPMMDSICLGIERSECFSDMQTLSPSSFNKEELWVEQSDFAKRESCTASPSLWLMLEYA